MTDTRGYIVCDLCGHLEAADREPPAEWACRACRESESAWWFPIGRRAEAAAHAGHIADRYRERTPA